MNANFDTARRDWILMLRDRMLETMGEPLAIDPVLICVRKSHEFIDGHLANWIVGNEASIACRKGCDHCCHLTVWVTAPEVLYIASELRNRLGEIGVEELLRRIDAARSMPGFMVPAERKRLRIPCALLTGNACGVYGLRPIGCRGYFSGDRDACQTDLLGDGGVPLFPWPLDFTRDIRLAMVAALLTRGIKLQALEFLTALGIALRDHDAGSSWIGGEDPFKEAVPHGPIIDLTLLVRQAIGDSGSA